VLGLPVRCIAQDQCSVQNYVDLKAGPGLLDNGCGVLTYDGHRGTDFQIRDLSRMRAGVPVVAAAAGTVRAVRDGMPDGGAPQYADSGIADAALGNAVVLEHGGGWTTIYGHLQQSSVRVRQGERVAKAQQLGVIGFSGNSEFPHLHFEVRWQGAIVDPYLGRSPDATCGSTLHALWEPAVLTAFPYRPTGVVCAGLAPSVVSRSAVLEDCGQVAVPDRAAPALVAWVELYGVRRGDILEIELIGPGGETVTRSQVRLEKDRAREFRYVGRRRPAAGWNPGPYRGRYVLRRAREGASEVMLDVTRTLSIP
jgi:murein DD-endopeptidase MepM/ murein hydrolase activator NlpD